jgi:superfamily II DNA or RNA helicase
MLTEGWDANNVTHILGIRAFGSQLLCEQVVGRGLRRMDYTPIWGNSSTCSEMKREMPPPIPTRITRAR